MSVSRSVHRDFAGESRLCFSRAALQSGFRTFLFRDFPFSCACLFQWLLFRKRLRSAVSMGGSRQPARVNDFETAGIGI